MTAAPKTPDVKTRFTEDQVDLLKAPLGASRVSKRVGPGGKKLDYLEGWDVIAHANHVFGFDGWDRETLEMVEMWNGTRTTYDRNNNATDKACVAFRCKVRVTVFVGDRKIVRDGTGFGDGSGRDLGEAFELATKEAETDAMKRAFMTFGNGFGLALYDKTRESVVDDTQDAAPAPQEPARRDAPREPERAPRTPPKQAPARETMNRAISETPEDRREPSESERLEERNAREDRGERGAPRQSPPEKPAQGDALAKSKASASWKAVAIKAPNADTPRDQLESAWNAWTERLENGIKLAPDRDSAIQLCTLNAKAMDAGGDVLATDLKKWAYGVVTRHHGAAKGASR